MSGDCQSHPLEGRQVGPLNAVDHFAALALQPAPWLDADAVKEQFFRMGAKAHPDSGGTTGEFAQLNAAWLALRDPAECLRHYLELRHPDLLARASQTPPELADLFMDIAAERQRVQGMVRRISGAASPLLRSLLEPERQAARRKVEALAARVSSQFEAAKEQIRTAGAEQPEVLAGLLATMVFLTKWSRQLADSAAALDGVLPA